VALFRKLKTRRDIGDTFEDQALAYLERNGLTLVTRNWRCAQGEIDLVMREGANLVFIEVRQRSSNRFGGALASIDQGKLSRVSAAVNVYISKLPRMPSYRVDAIAFDTAAVNGEREAQWIKNILA
jgi:putative endonuclease